MMIASLIKRAVLACRHVLGFRATVAVLRALNLQGA
jgi:hypothetical protein